MSRAADSRLPAVAEQRKLCTAWMRLLLLTIACAASTLLPGYRWFDPDVHKHLVNIRYLSATPSEMPTDVAVVAGDDKFWWPHVQVGQPRSVTLLVAKNAQTTLVLQFELGGTHHSWESDDLTGRRGPPDRPGH